MKVLNAGAQKAWMGAALAFVTTLMGQIINNQPVDVDAETIELATLGGQLAFSLISAGLGYVVVYLKSNILKMSDGTQAKQEFVVQTPIGGAEIVDPATGSTKPIVRSHWVVGLAALALAGLSGLSGCGWVTAQTGVSVAQQENCLNAIIATFGSSATVGLSTAQKGILSASQCFYDPTEPDPVVTSADNGQVVAETVQTPIGEPDTTVITLPEPVM